MKVLTDADRHFLERLEAGQFQAGEFNHREHVRLAYIYLSDEPFDLAVGRMERSLLRLLAHLGAPPSKYHKTLTTAWLLAVRHFMHLTGRTSDFEAFVRAGGIRLLDKEIMGTHYSPELLFSEQARQQFVEADLEPIPTHAA